jgi:hypothetical protein
MVNVEQGDEVPTIQIRAHDKAFNELHQLIVEGKFAQSRNDHQIANRMKLVMRGANDIEEERRIAVVGVGGALDCFSR